MHKLILSKQKKLIKDYGMYVTSAVRGENSQAFESNGRKFVVHLLRNAVKGNLARLIALLVAETLKRALTQRYSNAAVSQLFEKLADVVVPRLNYRLNVFENIRKMASILICFDHRHM